MRVDTRVIDVRKVMWAEGPAPAWPIGQPRFFEGLDPSPPKVKGSSECLECGICTTHMKRYVVQYHIAKHFWQIISLMICWVYRQFDMSAVIRQHSGRFQAGKNLQEFVSGLKYFFAFIFF